MKKINIGVVLITLASVICASAAEWFDWCGSTTTVNTTACEEFGPGAGCKVEGAACETTTTVYACSGAAWVCWPSSCNRTVGPTVTKTCQTVSTGITESWYDCDCQ